jgi:hypothetical protein
VPRRDGEAQSGRAAAAVCEGRLRRRQQPAMRTLEVIFFSAISTTPSFARHPMAAPAFEIASIAYSTW